MVVIDSVPSDVYFSDVCGQQFDVIYDSRSIPAINVADRVQYVIDLPFILFYAKSGILSFRPRSTYKCSTETISWKTVCQ